MRRETLSRGVVHALRVVGRLLSVERHALLRNGLVVGLELRLQLNLVRGASAAGLNGPVVKAGASVLVNHNGIGDPRDEKEETAQMLSATSRRGRGRGGDSQLQSAEASHACNNSAVNDVSAMPVATQFVVGIVIVVVVPVAAIFVAVNAVDGEETDGLHSAQRK